MSDKALRRRAWELESIVYEFSHRGYVTDSIGACVWCRAILWSQYGVRYFDGDKPTEHKPDCLLRRAAEAITPLGGKGTPAGHSQVGK